MATSQLSRAQFVQWINDLSQDQRDKLIEKIKIAQSWINEFALALGKRRAPEARIGNGCMYYAPWSNVIAIPAKTLLGADDRLLRIAVAHECGHFSRRWISLFSRTKFARQCEEVHADRVAMTLTGATLDDLDAVIRQLVGYEGHWPSEALDAYIEHRRLLLQSSEAASVVNR